MSNFVGGKTCVVCDDLFESKNNSSKFCGDVCRKKSDHDRKIKDHQRNKVKSSRPGRCVQCDKDFTYVYDPRREPRNFCGRSCASKHYIADGTYDTWRTRTNPKQERFPVNCVVCGKERLVLQREIDDHKKNSWVFTCDVSCRNEYVKLTQTGRSRGPASEEAKANQKKTMLERHGVPNAFMLTKNRQTVSKGQRELFEFLVQTFPSYEFEIEKRIVSEGVNSRGHYADIVSFKKKLIIEYYGDYWHCHPVKYAPTFFHEHKRRTAQEIWDEDEHRSACLKDAGFDVIVFWESETKKVITTRKQEINSELIKMRLQERGYSV